MRRLLVTILCVLALAAGLITVARITSPTIDGIACNFSEGSGYHIHALLTIINRGQVTHPPAGVGFQYLHFCLYWVHTHDDTGVIHVEAPRTFTPTLRNFFDVWGQPLTAHEVWHFPVPSPGSLHVFLDDQRFQGDPGTIRLREHTAVTIEIGPPFVTPPTPDFHGL